MRERERERGGEREGEREREREKEIQIYNYIKREEVKDRFLEKGEK